MNAAILLVTTAWFAGADPVPTTAVAPRTGTAAGGAISSATAPVISGMGYGSGGYGGMGYGGGMGGGGCGSGGCGGGGCGECCASECCCSKPGLCARLRARRQQNCCNTCCETGCNSGCGSTVSSCGSSCGGNVGCGCETCCSKPGLCARLRARRHQNCCCECGCGCESFGGCGGGTGCGGAMGTTGIGGIGGTTVPGYMPGAEKINPPKDATPGNKMPTGGKGAGTVQSQGLGLTPASSLTTPSF